MTMMMAKSRDQGFTPNGRPSSYALHRTPHPALEMGSRSSQPRSHPGADETLLNSITTGTISEETVSSMVFSEYSPGSDESDEDSYSYSPSQSAGTGGSDAGEPLSRVSSNSSIESSIEHGVRYKLTMKLSARDIMLIRESWSILLDDECAPEKLKTFITKLQAGRTLATTDAANNKPRRPLHQSMSLINRKQQPSLAEQTSKLQGPSSQNGPDRTGAATNIKRSNSLFGDQFLENIIALAPDLETLFPMIKHIAVGVTGMLTIAVNNLEDLSVLDSFLGSLGKRHARVIGVQAEQFEFAGIAFIKTIRERFGVYCTHELEETWRRVYSFLANSLLQAGIDPVIETKTPASLAPRREEQVVVMHPPELIHSGVETRTYAPKSELPPAPSKPVQRSLLDPLSLSREHKVSPPVNIHSAVKIPPRRAQHTSKFGSRKENDKDCVIM
ncbi:LAME_0C09428g1_1 [Lachancea meyersii CBS 8951]|uniref:LAME_0C09428g1_1 n=1 Tax=Lachancea meyersii CBS 8951 TaxID=1266667 RepID=A0A1G4J3V9_9SACH|nr:LAME_0C09428g1_1 [Lachancea meyersii CBS 8951]